jgi:hypothetical protein
MSVLKDGAPRRRLVDALMACGVMAIGVALYTGVALQPSSASTPVPAMGHGAPTVPAAHPIAPPTTRATLPPPAPPTTAARTTSPSPAPPRLVARRHGRQLS